MFRFLVFLALVFGVYVVLYGTPPVTSIDNSLSPGMREMMVGLHESALHSIADAFAQGRAALDGLGHSIAAALHH